MKILSADFVASFISEFDCPDKPAPEFAFLGRSNVGKSSLINMLVERRGLVKVSGTPGKTRTLNFFLINNQFHFVDLPGYGYAKLSRKERSSFEIMIEEYLTKRRQLACLFLLLDSRHAPQQNDIDQIEKLGKWQVPFVLVFTKTDKEGMVAATKNRKHWENLLRDAWEKLPPIIMTSAEKRWGREEIFEVVKSAVAK